MPSRKSKPNDTPSDSGRSSMRRLSSIASLHQLIPFTRRRSHNPVDGSDASPSCSSDFSSPTASMPNSADSRKPSAASSSSHTLFDSALDTPAPSHGSRSFLRGNSYTCLPDDPIGGMPRSRTFSNLPLPSRARRNPAPKTPPSFSHPRQPSNLVPTTRIPTPPGSTRQLSTASRMNAVSRLHNARNKLMRSDTEPLLSMHMDKSSQLPRPTAFKENISSSPIKPLPPILSPDLGALHLSRSSTSTATNQAWVESDGLTALPRQPSFSGTLPISSFASHPAVRSSPRFTTSSPGYDFARHNRHISLTSRAPAAVQRWNSQPLLSNVTNHKTPRRHEVKETRLMSARQPPTPPPPKTPLNDQALTTGRLRSRTDSSNSHARRASELSPLTDRLTPALSSSIYRGGEVLTAESPAYWCGRLSSLLDRYRNEELEAHSNGSPSARTKSESDKLHTPNANTARLRRALEHLHSLCLTEAARESFVVFQLQYAAVQNMPELSKPIVLGKPAPIAKTMEVDKDRLAREESQETEGSLSGSGKGGMRKISFVDKLLGRSKRNSLIGGS